jgi:hypothetical protein
MRPSHGYITPKRGLCQEDFWGLKANILAEGLLFWCECGRINADPAETIN